MKIEVLEEIRKMFCIHSFRFMKDPKTLNSVDQDFQGSLNKSTLLEGLREKIELVGTNDGKIDYVLIRITSKNMARLLELLHRELDQEAKK